tara:strand:+ start:1988 stop:2209 length:222 start_codon:yes stop_codon:yes gene_type:complete
MIKKNSRIYVAGHKGLVGSSILRKLKDRGYKKIITETKSKLDLTDQLKVLNFLKKKKTRFYFYSCSESWWNLF